MKLLVVCEFRFMRTPDGKTWTTSAFAHGFWERYLVVFDEVLVVARVNQAERKDPQWVRADGEKVTISALPYYVGLAGLLGNLFKLRGIARQHSQHADAILFRVPSQTAMLTIPCHGFGSKGYALEVVGDPADVFAAGITNRWLDKVLGWASASMLRYMVKRAHSVSYVTQAYLQGKYPARMSCTVGHYSSIELPDDWFAPLPRKYLKPATRILFIGSFGQLYKGQDVLIRAIARLKNQGVTLNLTMLGGGVYLQPMRQLAADLGIENQVMFVGEVKAASVREYLNAAEVFVMPSRTEGLPRALIEAMATALPAIGTFAGGIPELLPPERLYPAEDIDMLAQKLVELCSDLHALNADSARNLQAAADYRKDTLVQRRTRFYQSVAENSRKLEK